MNRLSLALACVILTACDMPDPEVPCADTCRVKLHACRDGLIRNVDVEAACMAQFGKCQTACN